VKKLPAMNNLKLDSYGLRLLHANYHLNHARLILPKNHRLQADIMRIIDSITEAIETDCRTPDSRERGQDGR